MRERAVACTMATAWGVVFATDKCPLLYIIAYSTSGHKMSFILFFENQLKGNGDVGLLHIQCLEAQFHHDPK